MLREIVLPGRTVLVVQELQNGVVGTDSPFSALAAAAGEIGVVRNAARLADAARRAGVAVVHATAQNLPEAFGANRNSRLFAAARRAGATNAPHTTSVEPVAAVHRPGDVVLPRYHGLSPMTGGPLDSLLRNSGLASIVVAGVSLNLAIPNLVFDAINRSYEVVVVSDAVAGTPVDYGDAVLRHSLALVATLATTDQVVQAWVAEPAER